MLMKEWIRVSYHCPIDYDAYLALPRWSRMIMQLELSAWIEQMNETSDTSAMPRTTRRGGF